MPYFSLDILTQRIAPYLKGRSTATLFIFLALSFLLLVLPIKLKRGISEIAFNFTYRPFYSLANRVEELYRVQQRNEFLSQKVVSLTLENARLQEERLENERLRKMLGFKSSSSFRLIPAKVIAEEPGRLPTSVWINLGEKDGLKKGMTVVNLNGLVGRVSEVLVGTSKVQLLFHPQCKVAALDQRSRVQGIVKSKGGVILDFENVPAEEDVDTTDQIYTSGLGGIFPAGIKIGEVITVEQRKESAFKTVKLKPAVNFFRLEELFLIKL